jgi:alginate O-acetyltransferase complex protein AlgI
LAARSVTDFWGRRWNRAFRDLTYPAIFRPLAIGYGPATGTLAVFTFSGLVHELLISVPAGGGFGLPTLYFLLQGLAVLAESRLKNPPSRKHGFAHRTIATIVVAAPLPLLFHPPFVNSVVVPFLKAICP